MNEPFFDACNALANRRHVALSFFMDEYGEWKAQFSFSDARGPYSAVVGDVKKRTKTKLRKEETSTEYAERVAALCVKAMCAAHASRSQSMAA